MPPTYKWLLSYTFLPLKDNGPILRIVDDQDEALRQATSMNRLPEYEDVTLYRIERWGD